MTAGEEQSVAGLSTLCLAIPGGFLNSAQLKAIARISAEKGGGFADLTPRQEIHLHGIKREDLSQILQALEGAGISSAETGAGGSAATRLSAEAGPFEDAPDASQDRLGVHEQKQEGLFTLGFPVAAGRIRENQMRKAADLAERHGDGTMRITSLQNLLILNIPHEKVAQVLEGLEMVGLSVSAPRAPEK